MGEYTPIRNLKPGMKDLTLMVIVLDVSFRKPAFPCTCI